MKINIILIIRILCLRLVLMLSGDFFVGIGVEFDFRNEESAKIKVVRRSGFFFFCRLFFDVEGSVFEIVFFVDILGDFIV